MPRLGKVCQFLSCPSKSHLHREKKFYPFVKPWMDHEKCMRWISASGRKDLTPVFIDKHSHVCEDHFVNGAPSAENPDPLPYDFLTKITKPSEHIKEYLRASDDHVESSVNDSLENVAETPCAREGYGTRSTENPDPLQSNLQASTLNTLEQAHSPVKFSDYGKIVSQRRRAELALKQKAIFRKKTSGINWAPY